MDLRKIKKLIELVEESGVTELEVSSGDESIRISMAANATMPTTAPVTQATPAPASAPAAVTGTAIAQEKAPMAGVVYVAPSPEAEPFVALGQVVNAGD